MKAAIRCVLLLSFSAVPAMACPFCYDALKGSGSSEAALRHAILTLLLPTVGLMLGIVGFAFRYNRDGHEDHSVTSEIGLERTADD